MNKLSANSEKTSRRTFTKSVAAAMVTAPFAFAEVRSQRLDDSQKDSCKETHPDVCPQLGDITVPHEPPIGISGGSLTMECESEMHRESSINNGPRKHLYDFEDYHYGTMVRLEVITEYEKLFTYECYPLGEGTMPRLKIWLQRLHGTQWVADDIDPAKTDAHILITYAEVERFSRKLNAAVVQTDKRFDEATEGFKLERTFRHAHKGYGGDTHFRIGRFRLMRGDGSIVREAAAGTIYLPGEPRRPVEVLGFQLIPRFNHLARLLKCLATGRE